MNLTVERLDEVIREVGNFEQTHLGVKYGADFPAIAAILMASEQFTGMAMALGMMALLGNFDIQQIRRKYSALEHPQAIEEVKEVVKRPQLNALAEMFYIGYRLGKQETEIAALNNLAEQRP